MGEAPSWAEALRRLGAERPAPSDPPSPDDLRPWRERIDAIDEAIIHLLNERAVYAAEIGHLKHALGIPVYAPEREEEVLANVLRANPGPLPPEAVRRLFERIIDETRTLERKLHAPPSDA